MWSGTEIIVWGGYQDVDLDDGARYNPALDSWTPVSPTTWGLARPNRTSIRISDRQRDNRRGGALGEG